MRNLLLLAFASLALPLFGANESVTIDTKTKKVVNPLVKFGSGNTVDCTGAVMTNCGSGGGGGGGVSSIATTSPITGGTITSTGTIGLNVGVDFHFTLPQTLSTTDVNSSGPADLLYLDHETSGSPSAGFGSSFIFTMKDSTTASQLAARITSSWSIVTHASRTAYLSFSVANNGGSPAEKAFLWGSGALSIGNVTDPGVPGISARFIPQAHATTSATSWTPDSNTYDQEAQTALAGNLTVNAPSGTPSDGKKLILRIKADSSSHTITWNSAYAEIGVTLPTTIAANKRVYIGCDYNSNATKWDVLAVAVEP